MWHSIELTQAFTDIVMNLLMGSLRAMTAAYRVFVFQGRWIFKNHVLQSYDKFLCSSSSSSPSFIKLSCNKPRADVTTCVNKNIPLCAEFQVEKKFNYVMKIQKLCHPGESNYVRSCLSGAKLINPTVTFNSLSDNEVSTQFGIGQSILMLIVKNSNFHLG